jgi:ariadne-1
MTPLEWAIAKREQFLSQASRGFEGEIEAAILNDCISLLAEHGKMPNICCTICLDEKSISLCTTLLCSHQFCNECLMEHLNVAWQHQTDANHQFCPHNGCTKEIQEADVRTFSHNDKDILHKFDVMKLRLCMHQNHNLRFCPGNDCTFIYEISDGVLPQKIKCTQPGCRITFCSHCQGSHNPQVITCQEAMQLVLMSTNQVDQQSKAWAEQHCKPCPSCAARIEKNAGCQYVKCGSCQELFCWECHESFGKQLTGHTGSLPKDHPWHQ